jgi:PKD repeat protein
VNALLRLLVASVRRARLPRSRRGLAACVALGAIVGSCSLVASAGAIVTAVGTHHYGYQPQTSQGPVGAATPLAYESGPVVHSSAPYAIYWEPKSGSYSGEWQRLISGFLRGIGSESGSLENVFAVATQYRDTSGANVAYSATFRGAFTDVDRFPSSENCSEPSPCLTDAQIRSELQKYIAANGLPSGLNPSSGPTPIYFVFTPPGTTVCLEGGGEKGHCSGAGSSHPLCGYHSFLSAEGSSSATVLYVVEPWTAGTYGTRGVPQVSGTNCQDGSGTLQEPNQIGLGPDGEYNAGLADIMINEIADEQIATTTDPLLTGWRNAGVEGEEVPDKCRNDFLGGLLTTLPSSNTDANTGAGTAFNQNIANGAYYLNDEFDQAALYDRYPGVPCINRVNFVPEFTSTSPARAGDAVTFNTTESVVDLGIAKYAWDFGDGSSADSDCEGRNPTAGFTPEECAAAGGVGDPSPVASAVHRYSYGGTYPVTLTLTDDGGNTRSVTSSVVVAGPPPPPPPAPSANSAATASSPTSSSTSQSTTTPLQLGPPAATATVLSRRLAGALASGLAVRYSVDRQVAGRFELLLASSLARRLRLRGPSATGQAAGTPAQTLIAKAVLVTTRGGRGTYKIVFSKAVAARLRKLRRVTMLLRMTVHGASSPLATTVLRTAHLR